MTVRKSGGIIVLEFINNAILAIDVRSDGYGAYNCYVGYTKLFNYALHESDEIFVQWLNAPSSVEVYMSLDVRSGNRLRTSASLVTYVSGKVSIYKHATTISISDSDMRKWLEGHGVARPLGCSIGALGIAASDEFSIVSIKDPPELFIITFSNGFKFPIFADEHGAKVVETIVCCPDLSLIEIYVQVLDISADFVNFRIHFVSLSQLITVDDIQYDRKWVSCGGSRVRTAFFTKIFALGGGYYERV